MPRDGARPGSAVEGHTVAVFQRPLGPLGTTADLDIVTDGKDGFAARQQQGRCGTDNSVEVLQVLDTRIKGVDAVVEIGGAQLALQAIARHLRSLSGLSLARDVRFADALDTRVLGIVIVVLNIGMISGNDSTHMVVTGHRIGIITILGIAITGDTARISTVVTCDNTRIHTI